MHGRVRQVMTPVYMPVWVRVLAIAVGLLILAPPLIHTISHVYLTVMHPDVAERLHTSSDWPRLVQIIVGAGIGFPDPVIGMIRAWRVKKDDDPLT